MKIQDIVFVVVFIALIIKHNPKFSTTVGLASILTAVPFFALWIFFTAQRLVWYGLAFLLLSIILHLYYARRV